MMKKRFHRACGWKIAVCCQEEAIRSGRLRGCLRKVAVGKSSREKLAVAKRFRVRQERVLAVGVILPFAHVATQCDLDSTVWPPGPVLRPTVDNGNEK